MSNVKPPGESQAPKAADRILSTASELFYREGARAIGVDQIVARAGATKPSLYRAFESKDHLIAVYLQGEGDRFWTYFDAAVAAHPDDPKAQLLAYFDGLGRRATEPGYRGCGLSNAAVEYPDPAHPGRKVAVEEKGRLRDRLRELTRAMGARKPKKLADSLLLLIEGVFLTSQLFGEDGPAAAARGAAEALIDAHTRGAS
ncbi:TetR/AcrR family transcriptional regulator [Phenylobacterium sp. SCN 70-31]|uniref:TetR/AcrR family transcriptional regulator n=1 Tax=Phenylobacterium sp. SCN 70-31 TaxID=1660129 RepID=UPI000868984D|nr:TetR/AcrR family transcriptional regulator [Phenylobacterium sp. SCN 70-31]ODT87747.1 MAG: TetR family transcriptional regulator [Phenylobacterium sp. SCN 70-31]